MQPRPFLGDFTETSHRLIVGTYILFMLMPISFTTRITICNNDVRSRY